MRPIWPSAAGNADLAARIASYELAFKMQQHAPEAVDLAGETAGHARRCTASTRSAPPNSAAAACWPGGWSNGASASCSSMPAAPHNDTNWDAHGDLVKNHTYHAGRTDSRSPA